MHVFKNGGEVIVELATANQPQMLRRVSDMRVSDVAKALRIIWLHTDYLMRRWREFHGEDEA